MPGGKGELLEEAVREYFFQEGYYALRSLALKSQGHSVTDVDVWLYRRVGTARVRSVVDVKSKKSPRAFERVLWVSGLKSVLGVERGIVATTDGSDAANRFASEHGIHLITRSSVATTAVLDALKDRMALEDFSDLIRSYDAQKLDGDWLDRIQEARSSLISANPFQAFNRAAIQLKFFADRIMTRPQQAEIAVRCAWNLASVCCIALDMALQPVEFSSDEDRTGHLFRGVVYGEINTGRTINTLNRVLTLVASTIENGEVIKRQVTKNLEAQFEELRADVIADFFSQKARASELFEVARLLDTMAFARAMPSPGSFPTAAKSILGVLSDFIAVPRPVLMGDQSPRNLIRGVKQGSLL